MYTGTPPPLDIWPLSPIEAQLPHHTMLWIEGGSFDMGNNDEDAYGDEKIIHKVTLKSFSLACYPVTQALYVTVMGEKANLSNFKGEDRPVERVSWDDAQQFIQRLNGLTGRSNAQWRYCLPSEAQWEYAARGGMYIDNQVFKYAGSNKVKEVGWVVGNSHSETKPVGMKQPNVLGLYDMSGNVWEWCKDRWDADYYQYCFSKDEVNNPIGPENGLNRVSRGGAWLFNQRRCRTSCRRYWSPDRRDDCIGFRICLECHD